MIGDFLARSRRPLFFDQTEREQLRVASNLPTRTSVWIARYAFPDHIGLWGTNSWNLEKTVRAFITTVLVGHLVVQVINLQCSPQWDGTEVVVNPENGDRPWPQMLTDVWPTKVSAPWPPNFSFKNDGASALIALSADIRTVKMCSVPSSSARTLRSGTAKKGRLN